MGYMYVMGLPNTGRRVPRRAGGALQAPQVHQDVRARGPELRHVRRVLPQRALQLLRAKHVSRVWQNICQGKLAKKELRRSPKKTSQRIHFAQKHKKQKQLLPRDFGEPWARLCEGLRLCEQQRRPVLGLRDLLLQGLRFGWID